MSDQPKSAVMIRERKEGFTEVTTLYAHGKRGQVIAECRVAPVASLVRGVADALWDAMYALGEAERPEAGGGAEAGPALAVSDGGNRPARGRPRKVKLDVVRGDQSRGMFTVRGRARTSEGGAA